MQQRPTCPHSPQGLPKDERQNEGRVPRPIDVELTEDLVEACMPGDVVTVRFARCCGCCCWCWPAFEEGSGCGRELLLVLMLPGNWLPE